MCNSLNKLKKTVKFDWINNIESFPSLLAWHKRSEGGVLLKFFKLYPPLSHLFEESLFSVRLKVCKKF